MHKARAAIGFSRVVYLYQSAARDNTALVVRDQRDRADTHALWLPAGARDAQARGLQRQPQAHLPLAQRTKDRACGLAPFARLFVTFRGLGSQQDPVSQQLEAGAAICLALEQLELVDLAFSLAGAPGHNERGAHGRGILLKTEGEGLRSRHAARAGIARANAVARRQLPYLRSAVHRSDCTRWR